MPVLDQVAAREPGKEPSCEEGQLPFEVLYNRYHLRVYRYLHAHLGNDDDAADMTQQVFFQAWLQLHTYQPGKGSFATWLFSIARHRLIDFYRAVHYTISWEALGEGELTLMELNPEEIVLTAEALRRVQFLLEALSSEERELLLLRFAARLSIAEIAAIIGKSVAATKKQLSRLLRRLQERYRRQDHEEMQPALEVPAASVFEAALAQIYAVSPPTVRLSLNSRSIGPKGRCWPPVNSVGVTSHTTKEINPCDRT